MIRRHYAIFRWQPKLGAIIVATFEKRSDAQAWAAVANDWLMERELYVHPGSYNEYEWHEQRSRERSGLVKPRAVAPMEPPSFDPGCVLSEGASYHADNYAGTRVRVEGEHAITLGHTDAPSRARWKCACGSVGRWNEIVTSGVVGSVVKAGKAHVAKAQRAERAWVRDRELMAVRDAGRASEEGRERGEEEDDAVL